MPDAERDTDVGPRTDPSPEGTPSPSGEPATSAMRRAPAPPAAPNPELIRSSDTLLSIPASASQEDLALDQRLAACERHLGELDSRVASLEERRKEGVPSADRKWRFWLLFLVILAIAWQILAFFR
jgi:hypothetical protein